MKTLFIALMAVLVFAVPASAATYQERAQSMAESYAHELVEYGAEVDTVKASCKRPFGIDNPRVRRTCGYVLIGRHIGSDRTLFCGGGIYFLRSGRVSVGQLSCN